MSKTRVLVVEDQTMPRQLFAMLIASSEEFELAAAIDSAEIADVYCLRNDVDLVLMDVLTRGGCSGLEAAARIKRQTPEVRIIVVTSMPECSYMDRARAAGVESFWYKEAEEASILDVMRRTMAGESVYPDAPPELTLGCASSRDFTGRELEVLREMTGGYTNTEIAERLHMSVGSVKAHILSMLDKTGFRNRTELAVRARESGLVILEGRDGA
ncbi:MAG: response regulator [Aristaeellaceae bacterium]